MTAAPGFQAPRAGATDPEGRSATDLGQPAKQYRDKQHLPAGMGNYSRWFRMIGPQSDPNARRIQPTDIDGMTHSAYRGDRFIFKEYKPHGTTKLETGQRLALEALARLPGCEVVVVFDPWYADRSETPLDLHVPVRMWFYKGTLPRVEIETTLHRLNLRMQEWSEDTSVSLYDLARQHAEAIAASPAAQ